MITVLKGNATDQQRDNLIRWFESQGLRVHISKGEFQTVLGLVGDTSRIDEDLVAAHKVSGVLFHRHTKDPTLKIITVKTISRQADIALSGADPAFHIAIVRQADLQGFLVFSHIKHQGLV